MEQHPWAAIPWIPIGSGCYVMVIQGGKQQEDLNLDLEQKNFQMQLASLSTGFMIEQGNQQWQKQIATNHKCMEQFAPLPRSSGSVCTTTARPTIEFAPLKGICKLKDS
jgi:hypothetical protein